MCACQCVCACLGWCVSPALSAENKSSAHLSLCVVQNTKGRLSYIVYLSDGTDSMSPQACVIMLEVQTSNRAPSFHLCALEIILDLPFGFPINNITSQCAACANSELLGAGKCCERTVTLREGSCCVSVPGFTRNISAGNLHTQTGYICMICLRLATRIIPVHVSHVTRA